MIVVRIDESTLATDGTTLYADLAFLVVALFVIAAGAIALISGLRGLKPSRLAPSKSISQISSLLGEFQDGADVR